MNLITLREHPELSVGMQTEGIDVRSVGNTATLHETGKDLTFSELILYND